MNDLDLINEKSRWVHVEVLPRQPGAVFAPFAAFCRKKKLCPSLDLRRAGLLGQDRRRVGIGHGEAHGAEVQRQSWMLTTNAIFCVCEQARIRATMLLGFEIVVICFFLSLAGREDVLRWYKVCQSTTSGAGKLDRKLP